jgi:hypothetical protein
MGEEARLFVRFIKEPFLGRDGSSKTRRCGAVAFQETSIWSNNAICDSRPTCPCYLLPSPKESLPSSPCFLSVSKGPVTSHVIHIVRLGFKKHIHIISASSQSIGAKYNVLFQRQQLSSSWSYPLLSCQDVRLKHSPVSHRILL